MHRQQKQRGKVMFEALESRTHFNGTISGSVHNDLNGDGLVDEFATTPAIQVYLDRNNNGRRDAGEVTVVTDVNGDFQFNNVPGGTYTVRLVLPKGFVPTSAKSVVATTTFQGNTKVTLPVYQVHYATSPGATVGQNAQHTGISPFRGGLLTLSSTSSEVTTATSEATTFPDSGFKLGTPLFTRSDTLIVPMIDGDTGKFEVRAFSRTFGILLWTFVSDYVAPSSVSGSLSFRSASAVFQPALSPDGKLYVPGAGGTVYLIAAPDRIGTGADRTKTGKLLSFYGVNNFHAKGGRYRATVFINTPLTVGTNGDVYFGVEGTGNNPLEIASSLVRMGANGGGVWTASAVIAGSAPALSNDESYVYVETQSNGTARLERYLSGTSLVKSGSEVLKDPKTQQKAHLIVADIALPVVAPDGDVYLAVPARTPSVANNGDGWLLRFSGDLSHERGTSAQVVGDATPSIVPSSIVASYHGSSSYLISTAQISIVSETFTITDPGQTDVPTEDQTTHPYTTTVPNETMMLLDPSKSLKSAGPRLLLAGVESSADQTTNNPTFAPLFLSGPATVDISGGAIYFVATSGTLMRWSLSDVKEINSPVPLVQNSSDTSGASPAVIGPDGEIYAIFSGKLYTAF
ncbi:MAG TPA: SdrD B-like domain-containing protein [Tepidisphaeraceae bacterium]|nr:SdrD B-like domain-containing protein [Tepidisphaeraceae bacterium]